MTDGPKAPGFYRDAEQFVRLQDARVLVEMASPLQRAAIRDGRPVLLAGAAVASGSALMGLMQEALPIVERIEAEYEWEPFDE